MAGVCPILDQFPRYNPSCQGATDPKGYDSVVLIAQLLGDATEQLSMKLGQTLGGLLNAT